MKKILILGVILSACLTACLKEEQKSSYIDIQESADSMRYERPQGVVSELDIPAHLKIELENRFPIWRDSVGVAVDVSLRNISKSHIPARCQAHLVVYGLENKEPIYWSPIDIAYGRSNGPWTKSVLSLPVGSSNDVVVPIQSTKWGLVKDSHIRPESGFYALIPSGKYLMRFELDIVNEQDQVVGHVVSNFIEFESTTSDKG